MNKKAIELSLNTIIILILAIIVLVVIIVAFRTQISALFNNLANLIEASSESDLTLIK